MVKKCHNAPGRIRINAVLRPLLVLLLLITLTAVGCSKKAGVAADGYFDPGPLKADQLQLPEVGEEIAVITTDRGVIKMRLFDKVAPKAVEDFKYRVREGFFNGLSFDCIKPNVKIGLANEVNPNIPAGVNYKNEVVGYENDKMHRFLVGSVMIPAEYESGKLVFGSFYIVCGEILSDDQIEVLASFDEDYISQDLVEAYRAVGGLTRNDQEAKYTVMGQVIYGLELVQKINGDPQEDNWALDPVIIEKVEIVPFEGR